MVTSQDSTITDRSSLPLMALIVEKVRLLCLSLVLSLTLLPASPAHALDKTINGITVDVNLPHARRGVPYQFQILPSGQSSPYSFQLIAGSLPAGFTLSNSGLLSGVSCVAANGTYKFGVRITSANGIAADFVGANGFSINMTAGPCKSDATGGTDGTDDTDGTSGTDGSDGSDGGNGTDNPDGAEESGGTPNTDNNNGSGSGGEPGGPDGSSDNDGAEGTADDEGTDSTEDSADTGSHDTSSPTDGSNVTEETDDSGSNESWDSNDEMDGTDGTDGTDAADTTGGTDATDGTGDTEVTGDGPGRTNPADDNGRADKPGAADNADGSDDTEERDQADGTNAADGIGGSSGSDSAGNEDANGSGGSDETGYPDSATNTDGADDTNGTDESESTDGPDVSDGTDESENADEPDASDGVDGRDSSDGSDSNERPDDSDLTNVADETRLIRAADGEIIIDLSSSPAQSGMIDLASLTMSDSSAGPVTYEIVAHPTNGNARLDGSLMTYVPSPNAESDTIEYVAIQGSVRSAMARVSVGVIRASLVDDQKLIDFTRAQLDAAAAAGFVQLNAIAAHLEAGSWDDRCMVQNRITVRSADGSSDKSAEASEDKPLQGNQCRKSEVVRIWTSGVLTIDDRRGRISTDGMTAGIEATPSSTSVAGLAVGVSRSQYDLSEAGNFHLKGLSVAAYGAWRPGHRVHLSGAVGYSGVEVGVRRQLGLSDKLGHARRSGTVLFAMFRAAAEFEMRNVFFSSYARGGLAKVQLGGGDEQTDHPFAVSIGTVEQTRFEGTLGATMRRPFRFTYSTLAPFARVERRWRTWDAFTQPVSYLDAAEQDLVRGEDGSSGSWSLGAGVNYQIGGVRLVGEYLLVTGPNVSLGDGVFRFEVSAGF